MLEFISSKLPLIKCSHAHSTSSNNKSVTLVEHNIELISPDININFVKISKAYDSTILNACR